MIRSLIGKYENSYGEYSEAEVDCLTGKITFPCGFTPTTPEIPELDTEAIFVKLDSMTIAVDLDAGEDGCLIACGSNFEHVQISCGTLTRYFLFEIHERVGELEYTTYIPQISRPEEDIKEAADKFLIDFYGEGNGEKTDRYGEYTVEFNNDSVGFITYKEITKGDWDVLVKRIR